MQTKTETFRAFKGAYEFEDKVPITAEAYDEAAGRAGACIEDAVDNHRNHSLLGDVRAVIAAALVAAGYARLKDKPDDKAYSENEDKFVQRLLASGELDKATLKTIGDIARAEKKINFIDTLGAVGTTRRDIGENWLKDADAYIAAWESGVNPTTGAPASAELTLEKMRGVWPGASLGDPSNRDEVARLLRDFDKQRRQQGTL